MDRNQLRREKKIGRMLFENAMQSRNIQCLLRLYDIGFISKKELQKAFETLSHL